MAVEMTRTGSKGVDKLTRSEIDQKIMRQLWLKKTAHQSSNFIKIYYSHDQRSCNRHLDQTYRHTPETLDPTRPSLKRVLGQVSVRSRLLGTKCTCEDLHYEFLMPLENVIINTLPCKLKKG